MSDGWILSASSVKKIILSFLTPLIINCLIFFFLQPVFISYPLTYRLGRFSVDINYLDNLLTFGVVSFFVLISAICIYFANRIFFYKYLKGKFNDSFDLNILGFFIISLVASICSIVDCLFFLPSAIKNSVHIFSMFSLVIFSYSIINWKFFSTRKKKILAISLIAINLFSFVILPIYTGFLSKVVLFFSSIIFTLFYIEKKKCYILSTFVVIFLFAILPFQFFKGFYRDFFFDGTFQKYYENDFRDKLKYYNSSCDITSYLSSIPKPIRSDVVNPNSNIRMHRLDLIETGFSQYSFNELNQLISNDYSGNNFFKTPKYFSNLYDEMVHSGNYVVPMAINRMLGINNVSQDGSRAARLLILSSKNSPDINRALYGLLQIQGNGIPMNKIEGIHCLLLSKNIEVINYFLMRGSQEEKILFNSELLNNVRLNSQDQINEIIRRVKYERRKYFMKNFFIPDNLINLYTPFLERIDSSKTFILIEKLFINDQIKPIGLGIYSSIFYSFIPRFFWPQKPIIEDIAGLKIGEILGLYDKRNPSQSWALAVFSESILVGGFLGFFMTSFLTAILFSIYYYQALKSKLHLILYGNFAVINITQFFFSGFVYFFGGMIQSFIFLVVFITAIKLFRFRRL